MLYSNNKYFGDSESVQKETLQRRRPAVRNPAVPPPPMSPPDAQEDAFWNTPGAPARILQFSDDLLLDEAMDMGNVTTSFTSPVARKSTHLAFSLPSEDSFSLSSPSKPPGGPDVGNEGPDDAETSFDTPEDEASEMSILDGSPQEQETSSLDDATVVLSKVAPAPLSATEDVSVIKTGPSNEPISPVGTPSVKKKQKFRINNDVERIVVSVFVLKFPRVTHGLW